MELLSSSLQVATVTTLLISFFIVKMNIEICSYIAEAQSMTRLFCYNKMQGELFHKQLRALSRAGSYDWKKKTMYFNDKGRTTCNVEGKQFVKANISTCNTNIHPSLTATKEEQVAEQVSVPPHPQWQTCGSLRSVLVQSESGSAVCSVQHF